MSLFKVLVVALFGSIISGQALAFDFSNNECEFEVNFPFRPSIKKVVQPLGNNLYANKYMAQAGDKHSFRIFLAQCDTSFRFAPSTITTSQKQQLAELSIGSWSKMVGLKHTQMFWEKQGNHVTLRMNGQRVIVGGETEINFAYQARLYLGQKSMMMVGVGEPAKVSPSAEMYDFLNNSVSGAR
jgi:hypothetical protein